MTPTDILLCILAGIFAFTGGIFMMGWGIGDIFTSEPRHWHDRVLGVVSILTALPLLIFGLWLLAMGWIAA